MDLNSVIQGVVAMLMITFPPDPAKILLFNTTIERQGKARTSSALFVALVVLAVLVGAALFGRQLLQLLGINLDAFSVVGGLIIFSMGMEMLYGGAPSRTQSAEIEAKGPQEDSGLIIPLAIPLLAGPGAIVTAISISSINDSMEPLIAALAGAVAVAIAAFVSFEWLGGLISRLSPTSTAVLVRIGGLLLATIGAQMVLGGIKKFFAA
jgi:multiple antibiotic resistance protein